MKLIAVTGLLLIGLLGVSCTPGGDFDAHLSSIVKPYRLSITGWESRAVINELGKFISGRSEEVEGEDHNVIEYFSSLERIKTLRLLIEKAEINNSQCDQASFEAELNRLQEQRAASQDTVETILEKQVRDTLLSQGIFNPVDKYIKLEIGFPPVNFKLEKPPLYFVISARDRIESIRRILLKQSIGLDKVEDIETEVDKLGVSSLVVELGGLSTYPNIVTDEASLRFTVDAVAEEWLHQYLVFKPLGFRYLLDLIGVSRNYEIATMNETVAGMVSKEIGFLVLSKYYPEYESRVAQREASTSGFDFNREMREIRKAVDGYLARGEVERAEDFMEEKRQYLVTKGYYIRKLNQAYFAFYGTYGDSPTSISPIGVELRTLRSQSASLKDFLDTVAAMTSRQALKESIK